MKNIVSQLQKNKTTSIRTYTGIKFWPLKPKINDIDIVDIAHALSLICRFTGHTVTFYSVADHSLRVSDLVEETVLNSGASASDACDMALWGLVHDSSEAYLCDVPSPLKRAPGLGELYKVFEKNLMEVIIKKFELLPTEPPEVKTADIILLNTEMRDLMNNAKHSTNRLEEIIVPRTSQEAESLFLQRFDELIKIRELHRRESFKKTKNKTK
jgi:5'-deoxynucleotidase YfbR-like HD superfamily hydrolase